MDNLEKFDRRKGKRRRGESLVMQASSPLGRGRIPWHILHGARGRQTGLVVFFLGIPRPFFTIPKDRDRATHSFSVGLPETRTIPSLSSKFLAPKNKVPSFVPCGFTHVKSAGGKEIR